MGIIPFGMCYRIFERRSRRFPLRLRPDLRSGGRVSLAYDFQPKAISDTEIKIDSAIESRTGKPMMSEKIGIKIR